MNARVAAVLDAAVGRVDRARVIVEGWDTATRRRVAGAALGLPASAVLLIARWLDPDPRGFGTHTQLGLGACTLMQATGYPCPMCGMTTTFALLAEGRLPEAIQNQPFGLVLFAATALAAALGLADLAAARGAIERGMALLSRWERAAAWGLLGGLALGWIYKILRVHPELVHYLLGGS